MNITGLALTGLLVMGFVLIIKNIMNNGKKDQNKNDNNDHKYKEEGEI
ncbi:MAG: hypothetical protein JW705_01505 [Methanosarcinaceae archaeon]|nr:hypothetical protein [Methanosarcinaceae archaeon]